MITTVTVTVLVVLLSVKEVRICYVNVIYCPLHMWYNGIVGIMALCVACAKSTQ